jgi:hypothetical protein
MANEPSNTYGPVEDADTTRQAQHTFSNDVPTDVNNNAALARRQASTTANAGDEFAAAAARRTIIADTLLK